MFAPFLWLASLVSTPGGEINLLGLMMLEVAFGIGYIGARALTLGLRYRGEAWLIIGEKR